MAGDSTWELCTKGKTEEWEPEEMVEDVVLAEIFSSGLIRCVDTLTGMHKVPEVSLPWRAVRDACVSRALWRIWALC